MCKYCKVIQKEHFSSPKEGDLRIWWIPQVPMNSFHYPVKSIHEAKLMLETLAQYDLFQYEHNIKPDFSNAGGLEIFEGEEWLDWENEDGDGIDQVDDEDNLIEE